MWRCCILAESTQLVRPRHLFLPSIDLTTAYAPKQVVTKHADDGTAVSSASSPNIVAKMLEQLGVHPGHRVLEIGAATGVQRLPDGRWLAAAETVRRGGGSAMVVSPAR